jgi:hypothetical protein
MVWPDKHELSIHAAGDIKLRGVVVVFDGDERNTGISRSI